MTAAAVELSEQEQQIVDAIQGKDVLPPTWVLYLIGQPGAGKTTVVRKLLENVPAPQRFAFGEQWFDTRSSMLGFMREQFGGTDALGMNVQPKVEAWLTRHRGFMLYVFGEGDRLGNDKFFTFLKAQQFEYTVAYLDTPDEVAAERRRARGSTQSEAWVKGRQTKARRLADKWTPDEWRLDGTQPVEVNAMMLSLHPVFEAIRRQR